MDSEKVNLYDEVCSNSITNFEFSWATYIPFSIVLLSNGGFQIPYLD